VPSVRRQLRDLETRKEEGLRELGAMALEMHRRDQFQMDILEAHARDLREVEEEIRRLDPARGDTHT
jgi:hypothetical protein